MKLRNKVLTGIMMTSLMCAAIGGGFSMAEEGVYTETSDGRAYTAVTYSEAGASTYTVSIPATLQLDKDISVKEQIDVSDCSLATEVSTLVISILDGLDENGRVRLALKNNDGSVNQNGPFVYSTVTNQDSEVCLNNMEVLLLEAADTSGSAYIEFAPPVSDSDTGEITAGDYEGQLTFGISVVTPE